MQSLKINIKKFLQDESGATAIEYGMIAISTTIIIILPLAGIKGWLVSTYTLLSKVFDWI